MTAIQLQHKYSTIKSTQIIDCMLVIVVNLNQDINHLNNSSIIPVYPLWTHTISHNCADFILYVVFITNKKHGHILQIPLNDTQEENSSLLKDIKDPDFMLPNKWMKKMSKLGTRIAIILK